MSAFVTGWDCHGEFTGQWVNNDVDVDDVDRQDADGLDIR